jgi:hypothetical protein
VDLKTLSFGFRVPGDKICPLNFGLLAPANSDCSLWGFFMPKRPATRAAQALAFTARCEKCGGYSFISRTVHDAFKRDGSEIWTYECVDCGHRMQRSVKL